MRMRIACGLAAACTLPAYGQLPDIRGMTFDRFKIQDTTGGQVFGQPVQVVLANGRVTNIPHTFEVAADPSAPGDPSRLLLRTRLTSNSVSAQGIINPNGIVYFDLPGTYNRTTGAIAFAGSAPGTQDWHLGDNALGIFPVPPDWTVWSRLTNPFLSMTGTVTMQNLQPRIVGSDVRPNFPGPGNMQFNAPAELFLLPPGVFDPGLSPLPPIPVEDPFYGFSWTAAIPTPGSLAVLGIAGIMAARRRRR